MTGPILYSFRRCPYAMRARMALLVSAQAVEIREVVLRAKPPAMLAASPKGTVPVLVLAGGEVIDESLDIMRYALGQNDPENWFASDDSALIAANDGPFKHHLDRYKYPDRHDSDPRFHRGAALECLAPLEAQLSKTPCLRGSMRTLVDIALFPFVRQFAAVDADWFAEQGLPRIKDWLTTLTQSELFERAMVRRPPWRDGDPPVLLN